MIDNAWQTLIEAIGWTLIHVVWQAALAAAAVGLLWAVVPRAKPNLRYVIACGGLFAVAIAGLITFACEVQWHIEQAGQSVPGVVRAAVEQHAGTATASSDPAAIVATPAATAGWRSAIGETARRWLASLGPWLPAIVLAWAIGVGLLSARLLIEWRSIRRVSSGRRKIEDPALVDCLKRIAGRLGIRRAVGLFACVKASVPFVLGWLKPAILLPAELLTGLSPAEFEAIIAHELAHVRRHDYLVNLLQSLVETIYFYHPAVWWMSRLVRREREICCDELAAAACGDRVAYGRALMALEQWRGGPARLQVAANGGSLVERIRRLTGADAARQSRPGAVFLAIIALFCTAVALVAVDETRAAPHDDAQQVTFMTVEPRDVTFTQQYVAQIKAHHHIDIRVPESGYISAIAIKEGQMVKRDDVLFQVRPLSENEAGSGDGNRLIDIKAPFDGVVDRLRYQQGSFVREGETLTTLSDNSLMSVYFNVPEPRYLEYMKEGLDQHRNDLKIDLILANGAKFAQPGKLVAIGGEFNSQAGNIPFRADFLNPDRVLRHGQTGTVSIPRLQKGVLTIPQRATFEVLAKRYAYVVDKDNVAHQRAISYSAELEDLFLVSKGLVVGDRIVVDGIRQIHDGDKVRLSAGGRGAVGTQ